MVGHGGSSAGSYLADPTSPIPSHCASIVMTSTLRVNSNIRHIHTYWYKQQDPNADIQHYWHRSSGQQPEWQHTSCPEIHIIWGLSFYLDRFQEIKNELQITTIW